MAEARRALQAAEERLNVLVLPTNKRAVMHQNRFAALDDEGASEDPMEDLSKQHAKPEWFTESSGEDGEELESPESETTTISCGLQPYVPMADYQTCLGSLACGCH
eukprot:5146904-Amphidinium_carterae.1